LNEILEIVTVLGNLLKNSKSAEAMSWLRDVRAIVNAKASEVEIALARIDPELYVTEEAKFGVGSPASIAAGLREIANIKKTQPEVNKAAEFLPSWMHDILTCSLQTTAGSPRAKSKTDQKCLLTPVSVSPFLQAYAAYQPGDLRAVLTERLNDSDVVVRSTAAELLGEQPPSEANTRALIDALPRALRDQDSDDAVMAILGGLAKQKSTAANDAIKTALDSSNHLIRRRAVALLKTNGVGDFSDRIGTVQTKNTALDYRRAMTRSGRRITATVVTNRGSFTIQFLPEDAPLTVDNFVQLAKRGYFNGQTIPRVVPNFVVQAGDPRGDQNGGLATKFAVKSTSAVRTCDGRNGSVRQGYWRIAMVRDALTTTAPDGGYTVFGRVIRGMDVIDNIARGDVIKRVVVNRDEMNHRGTQRKPHQRIVLTLRSLCAQSVFLLVAALLLAPIVARGQDRRTATRENRLRYDLKLAINFDDRTYTGTEQVHWVNHGDRATSTIFLHLYPNMRLPDYVTPTQKNDAGQIIVDEPRLDITEVRAIDSKTPVSFSFENSQTTLRLNLREPLPPKAAVDIQIKFKGSVPEIDPEETGIVTHVLQQVSAAIRSEREIRRARDTNFVCRGMMMLSTSFPILAARSGDDWLRKVEPSIGDTLTTDAADFNVTIETAAGVAVFTPVPTSEVVHKDKLDSHRFIAENLRDFSIIAGRNLKSEDRRIGEVTVRSLYRAEHEAIAQRVLTIAANALRIYGEKFGALPLKTVTVADVPLVATLGSAEFAGLSAIASAFYVDFDSPTMRNMPDVIRDQRASVEESLEWTVARVVAHQWWGAAVGNDAGREPVLDESLSWSALLYYREMHGEQQTGTRLRNNCAAFTGSIERLAAMTWKRVTHLASIGTLSVCRDRAHQGRADV
jgi:cyclophilin family peptidyl-prolyl cis-trans isomerase